MPARLLKPVRPMLRRDSKVAATCAGGWLATQRVGTDRATQAGAMFLAVDADQTADVFFVIGRERGWLQGRERLELAIRTSRIFRRETSHWKQFHHHGSIESPSMLAALSRVDSYLEQHQHVLPLSGCCLIVLQIKVHAQ